jgi:hypothetical protein
MYQKVGMFGMPSVPFARPGNNGFLGPQVRGFGFLHDGSFDTLVRFHNVDVFSTNLTEAAQLDAFMMAFPSNLAPIVGQQVTLTSTNAGVVGPRITLMLQRDDQDECEVVVKGTVAGEARGAYRQASGLFRTDRAGDALLTDAQVRALAATAGQELTYTCAPPGSGPRMGVDRDEDGFFDRDELDFGSDPADPLSFPGSLSFVEISTKALKLKDDPVIGAKRKLTFTSSTKKDPSPNRIVVPAAGGPGDPTLHGAELVVYNSSGLTNDVVTVTLDAADWTLLGSPSAPKGYKYIGPNPLGPVKTVLVKADKLTVKGGKDLWSYTLDEPAQGRVAVRLTPGTTDGWCADAPARTSSGPVNKNDEPGRFTAQSSPAPATCPAL